MTTQLFNSTSMTHPSLKKLLPKEWGHFIDGRFESGAASHGTQGGFKVLFPATDEVLGEIPLGDERTVDRAVHAAQKAFDQSWSRMSMERRAEIVRRMGDLILERADDFAELETLDTGKPIAETRTSDVIRAAKNLKVFSELAVHSGGRVFRSDEGHEHVTWREPLGVCGLITPWNLPIHLATWKLAPALMQGNCVILKPAEWTPLSAMALAAVAEEAGMPPGVFNIVHGLGPSAVGEALVRHPGIKAISFTGETTTGSEIMKAASKSLKKLSFELGGKGATVVFADADLQRSAKVAVRAAFRNQGQICLAGSRILIERKVAKEFISMLLEAIKDIKIGSPLDISTTLGSLIHRDHRDRVDRYVKEAAMEPGVEILCGGRPIEGPGAYYQPTLIYGVKQDSRIVQEEVFGPVATIQLFDEFDEALTLVNGTRYGLSSSVFSQDIHRAQRFARQARTGLVWINDWFLRDLHTAFGGMKHSGLGREGGEYSLDFYSEIKTISTTSPHEVSAGR